jgi:hypothetical protein
MADKAPAPAPSSMWSFVQTGLDVLKKDLGEFTTTVNKVSMYGLTILEPEAMQAHAT